MRRRGQEAGVEDFQYQYAAEAEEDEVADPHSAVEVHGFLAVVPPASVEVFFQNVAGDVFQQAAKDEGDEKAHGQASLHGGEEASAQGDDDGAGAVDGAVGADEKASVNKALVLEVF